MYPMKDRRGRVYTPAIGPRLKIVLAFIFALVALLGASGVYLLAVRLLEWYEGRPFTTQFSLWMFLAHVVFGVVAILPFLFFGTWHLLTARNRPNRAAVRLGLLLFIAGLLVVLSGVALIQLDGLPQLPEGTWTRWTVWALHVAAPVGAVWLYVLHRRAGPEIRWRWGVSWGVAVGAFCVAMIAMHSQDPRRWYARGSPEGEKYFEPSKSRTLTGNFIPASAMMMDEYCLKCHQDIYNSHLHSVHKLSSFNNPAYLFSVKETRERMGVRASRWCAGCHDPVPFFSGAFDDPDFDMEKHPTAHAGITCTVCHTMTHVNSRSGNGDYTIDEPLHYPFAYSDNPVLQWMNNQLVKAKPDFHKKTFLKPFHRTSDFCSTCHKVGVPMEVNKYKEFLRGQNHPDSHFLSGNKHGARSFYYPPKAKECRDCHMPLTESQDFGRQDFDNSGVKKVHSHMFVGANTGVAYLKKIDGWEKVVEAHKKFLQGGIDGKSPTLRIDLFGLKQVAVDRARAAALTTGLALGGTLGTSLSAGSTLELFNEAGVEAPLLGDAPLRPHLPKLEPGGTYLIETVVRTLNIGHHFTQGTADSNEVWVEITAKAGGRVLARSGGMEREDEGRVDPGAHFINVLMLDRHGNRVDRRNPQDIFTPLYDHQIPPGAANVMHYRLHVPNDVKGPVELSARVRFRKFDFKYMEHVYGSADKVPKLPIVDLCSDRVVLPVRGVAEDVPRQESPVKPAWQRWNDYGIACFLEGGPEGKKGGELGMAEAAFSRLLGPGFKDVKDAHAHGHLNMARVHLAYGGQDRLDKARAALVAARKSDPPAPWWTVAYFSGVVNVQNVRFEEAIKDFETILNPANQPRERKFDFTKDWVVINDLGKALFWLSQQQEGPEREATLRKAVARFEETLVLDAENVEAHEFLAKCYARLAAEGAPDDPRGNPAQTNDEERRQLALAEGLSGGGGDTVGGAKALLKALTESKGPLRLPALTAIRERCASAAAEAPDEWARVAITPVVHQADRLILAALPDAGKVLADEEASTRDRLEAVRALNAALEQLGSKALPGDPQPALLAATAVVPGLPVNFALAGLGDRGHLHGPMRQPRMLALDALRRQSRLVYEKGQQPELSANAAGVLSQVHLLLHSIFKPDENAQGSAIAAHRRRFPLADRASHPIVIYPMN